MNAKAANNAPANTTVQPSAFGDATFGHGDGGATFGGGITFGPSTTFGSSWVSLHLVTQTVRFFSCQSRRISDYTSFDFSSNAENNLFDSQVGSSTAPTFINPRLVIYIVPFHYLSFRNFYDRNPMQSSQWKHS